MRSEETLLPHPCALRALAHILGNSSQHSAFFSPPAQGLEREVDAAGVDLEGGPGVLLGCVEEGLNALLDRDGVPRGRKGDDAGVLQCLEVPRDPERGDQEAEARVDVEVVAAVGDDDGVRAHHPGNVAHVPVVVGDGVGGGESRHGLDDGGEFVVSEGARG